MDIINSEVEEKLAQLKQRFASAEPFAHVVIDNFFTEEFCQALLDQFPSFDERLAMNENGQVGRKAVNEKVAQLGPAYRQIDQLASSESFREWIGELTGIDNLLYDPHYFGGGSHENLTGQSLDVHVDFTHHPVTNWNRRLNLIVYLNHDWRPEWGGNIELHKNPRLPAEQDETVTVTPVFNRAVLFETHNHSWHGFKQVALPESESHRSRKSFALYFYTDDRENKVRPHSTIYVEERVEPSLLAPGHTLSSADSQALRNHITRRDHHLDRLYKNITDLMGQLQDAREYIEHLKRFEREVERLRRRPAPETVVEVPQEEPLPEPSLQESETPRERMLREELEAIENATFWKLTAPLRALVSKFRK